MLLWHFAAEGSEQLNSGLQTDSAGKICLNYSQLIDSVAVLVVDSMESKTVEEGLLDKLVVKYWRQKPRLVCILPQQHLTAADSTVELTW